MNTEISDIKTAEYIAATMCVVHVLNRQDLAVLREYQKAVRDPYSSPYKLYSIYWANEDLQPCFNAIKYGFLAV